MNRIEGRDQRTCDGLSRAMDDELSDNRCLASVVGGGNSARARRRARLSVQTTRLAGPQGWAMPSSRGSMFSECQVQMAI